MKNLKVFNLLAIMIVSMSFIASAEEGNVSALHTLSRDQFEVVGTGHVYVFNPERTGGRAVPQEPAAVGSKH
ncbi:MAG: hypothetical protein ABGZ37_01550 [Akkermansiaceae bacterium]